MTTNDVRDILNIKTNVELKPSKKAPKQRGQQSSALSKELATLIGERVPPVVLQSSEHYKKRFTVTRNAQPWEWQEFDNPCRQDGLKLKHWVKKSSQSGASNPAEARSDDPKSTQDSYYFAKYNFSSAVPTYTDSQYEQHLRSDDWTKEETDYLFSLARDYDLRWILIDDRYDFQPATPSADTDLQSALVVAAKPRTMEDLKVRYYQVAAATIILSHPQAQMTEAEFDIHDRMTKFNPEREKRRKEIATALMSRSPEEIKEEEILLAELRRIVANEEKFLEERKELYDRLDHPIAQHDTAAFQTSSGLQQLVQNLYYTDKNKKRKTLAAGETTSPAQNTSTPTTTRDNRRDGPASATTDKRKGSGIQALRTLSAADEKRFGVSTHDRLNSGVSFRSSRVDKLILAKSQIQSAKLQDAIRELSIPLRPRMPTIPVCAEYEKLITSIHTLLDARKVCEKVMNEIRIVKAQKGIGQDDENKEEGDVTKTEEDADADGEMDESTVNRESNKRDDDSDGEDNQDEIKLDNDEENEGEDNEAGHNDDEDDDEPTKASIESDNDEADEDRPLMPGDNDDEEEEEEDEEEEEVASVASPDSPPADDDDEDGEAEAEAEAEDEEPERPSSSRASVARSVKSTRSGRSAAATADGGNKHKRSASALSVSESEKSTGTRSSKRARK